MDTTPSWQEEFDEKWHKVPGDDAPLAGGHYEIMKRFCSQVEAQAYKRGGEEERERFRNLVKGHKVHRDFEVFKECLLLDIDDGTDLSTALADNPTL